MEIATLSREFNTWPSHSDCTQMIWHLSKNTWLVPSETNIKHWSEYQKKSKSIHYVVPTLCKSVKLSQKTLFGLSRSKTWPYHSWNKQDLGWTWSEIWQVISADFPLQAQFSRETLSPVFSFPTDNTTFNPQDISQSLRVYLFLDSKL